MGTLIAPAEIAIAGSRTLWGVTRRSDPLGGRGDPFRSRGQALRGGRRCTTEVISAATTTATAAKTSSPAEATTTSATMEAATSSATAPSHGRGEANAKG